MPFKNLFLRFSYFLDILLLKHGVSGSTANTIVGPYQSIHGAIPEDSFVAVGQAKMLNYHAGYGSTALIKCGKVHHALCIRTFVPNQNNEMHAFKQKTNKRPKRCKKKESSMTAIYRSIPLPIRWRA